MPRRLKTLAQKAGKGWLQATLSVGRSSGGEARQGLRASGVFVINPPFVLRAQLQDALPLISQTLQQAKGYGWQVESSA